MGPGWETSAARGSAEHPAEPRSESRVLRNLEDLVCDQTVCLEMHAGGRLFVRRLGQAEDGAAGLVEPVLAVFHPVPVLGLQVPLVRLCHGHGYRNRAVQIASRYEWVATDPLASPRCCVTTVSRPD